MDYGQWRRGIQERPRGLQRWASRVRIYEHVAADPRAVDREVSQLCHDASTAPSTFYACFGPASADRLIEAEPMDVVIAETKAWSIYPFLEGAADAFSELRPEPRNKMESLLRISAEWSFTAPGLAGSGDCSAPLPLLEALLACLRAAPIGSDTPGKRESLEDLVHQTILRAVERAHSETALGILNSVRAELAQTFGESDSNDATTTIIEAITEYAEHLATSAHPADQALLADLKPMFERFFNLIPRIA
jgi:hypothetical protein